MVRQKLKDAHPRLLAAGLSLLARHGSERVNSNAIARRAGVGIGTFYAHFEDKYALFHDIQIRTLTGLRDHRVAALRRAPEDPEAQAAAAITAAVEFAERHPEAYRVTFGRERAGPTKHRPIISESSRPTANILRLLQAEGRVDARVNVDLAARAYASAEVGTLLWWLEDLDRRNASELIDTLLRMHPVVSCRVNSP